MVGELPVLSSALKVVHELRFCCWLEKRLIVAFDILI